MIDVFREECQHVLLESEGGGIERSEDVGVVADEGGVVGSGVDYTGVGVDEMVPVLGSQTQEAALRFH